jgi:hypothetical protein
LFPSSADNEQKSLSILVLGNSSCATEIETKSRRSPRLATKSINGRFTPSFSSNARSMTDYELQSKFTANLDTLFRGGARLIPKIRRLSLFNLRYEMMVHTIMEQFLIRTLTDLLGAIIFPGLIAAN